MWGTFPSCLPGDPRGGQGASSVKHLSLSSGGGGTHRGSWPWSNTVPTLLFRSSPPPAHAAPQVAEFLVGVALKPPPAHPSPRLLSFLLGWPSSATRPTTSPAP